MALQVPPNGTGQVIDTLTTVAGKERQVVVPPSDSCFAVLHAPAAQTKATISKAAGAAGVKNVCTSFSFALYAGGADQAAVTVNLRDGATGAGTILWSAVLAVAAKGMIVHTVNGYFVGTAATAMTVEFSAAGGDAASQESVSMSGFTTA